MAKPAFLPAASRLTTRLILAFIVLVLVTSVVASIPAYLLIQRELERQAWKQVANGQHITLTLLAEEQARLNDLVLLVAQRPTLYRLLSEDQSEELPAYLGTLQSSVELDILIVRDASGRVYSGEAPALFAPDDYPYQASGLLLVDDQPERILLVASAPLTEAESGQLLGEVTVGYVLDDEFVRRAARETGFEQSLLLDNHRVATSLPDRNAVSGQDRTPGSSFSRLMIGGMPYYASTAALNMGEPPDTVLLETALPVEDVVNARQRAITLIALSTLVITLFGSGVAIVLARRLTIPLQELTGAALEMSAGDLTTPIPRPRDPVEIATLASALEESRKSILGMLEELTRAKEWSEALIGSIVEGVVTFDTHGEITFFSEGAERITGFESAHVVGQPLESVFRLCDGGSETFMDQMPPRGEKRQLSILASDNRPLILAITGARLTPPGGEAVQVALVFRDVTEEEAIRKLRSYFLANITHEFRTPLAALSASIELLLEEAEELKVSSIQPLISSLHLSVLHLQTLIDNLLESSSIEAGRFSIRRRPTQINQILGEAVRVVGPLLARREHTLSVTEPTHIAPVNADPTRLGQVLVNLLSNASKYSPPGSAIDVTVETGADGLRIAILDRGPGIPEVERENLFRRFVRLDTPGEEQYGIGLGLFVAKVIIEGHGGKIGVSERPGGGSVFWFTLPLEKSDESPRH